jgi:hypothetical protein
MPIIEVIFNPYQNVYQIKIIRSTFFFNTRLNFFSL